MPLQNVENNRIKGDSAFPWAKRLFVIAFDNSLNDYNTDTVSRVPRNSHRTYFLPTVEINNYNVSVDGRNWFDLPMNDSIKKSMAKFKIRQQYKKIITQEFAC